MERFVREVVKTSLWLIGVLGAVMIALGVALWLWPRLICLAAAWSLVLDGLFLCGRMVYAIVKAKTQTAFR